MRRLGVVMGICGLFPFVPASMTSDARAETWVVEDTSSVAIEFSQLGTKGRGSFNRFTPHIEFDEENPERCNIDVTIDLDSIDSGSAQRDDIIKSPEFFEVDTYPQASFNSNKCKNIGGNAYEAYGELTIRDISRPVMLPFTLDFKQSDLGLAAKAKAELPLSRYDYDLGNSPFWRETGILGRVVLIHLDIDAKVKDR